MSLKTALIILVLIFGPWCVNAYKFANCDFSSNYKCEAIHGIGIFVFPTSFITVWFDSDE